MKITIEDVLNIPYTKAASIIESFIQEVIENSNVEGVVIGLSGGIDSSVTLTLAVNALGKNNITALIMPDTRTTPEEDVKDAIELAKQLEIEYHLIKIDNVVDSFSAAPFFDLEEKIPTGNLRARVRMCLLYYYANKHNYIVVGTSDRSELLIGYYTKYGDGGVDILPIGCLYKTQVRKLGEYLGLPKRIVTKPSSPALWPGHLAEKELGLKYEVIDLVLYAIFDLGIPPNKVPDYTDVDPNVVIKIMKMHKSTRHKRIFPAIPKVPWIKNSPIKEL